MRRTLGASRSFVLAALRALHLDPACGPPPQARARTRPNNKKTTKDPPLRGSPTQIRTIRTVAVLGVQVTVKIRFRRIRCVEDGRGCGACGRTSAMRPAVVLGSRPCGA